MPDRDLTSRIAKAFAAYGPPERSALTATANFFEAGYTSVRLAEVLAELVALGVKVQLVDLYRYPTLQALTAEAERRGGVEKVSRTLPWQKRQ